MKVHQVMSVDIIAVKSKTPFRDIWKAIFKKHIHALPVIDQKRRIIGIISEEDLMKPLYPDYQHLIEDFAAASDFEDMEEKIHDLIKLKAEHIMNKRIIFTRPETPIMRALSRMIVRSVRQLPVLAENNTLLGVISKGDIFDTLFKKHLRLKGFVKTKGSSLQHHLALKKTK
ncbi:CBS domain-containing protein [Candidatus Gottesmanbacteria bacterium]|nr:CBS domain-containing protein [Candidatus Gottesmanbacteria bacterium]